jgi:hypothetical protein
MGTLKIQKSQIMILVLNQCSVIAVFPIVWFAMDQKTALTGESLYLIRCQIGKSGQGACLFRRPSSVDHQALLLATASGVFIVSN